MDWYRFVYRTSYLLGFTPWDRGQPSSGLVALVEGLHALPKGRAIDLGCGSGTNTIYLCKHGWNVTGVDIEPRAVRAARANAMQAGVYPSLLESDVTRLREVGGAGEFNMVVDVGCFHTLPARLRSQYVETVSALAATGATLFLYAFSAHLVAPMRSGVTRDEVEARFKGWELVSAAPSSDGQTAERWRNSAIAYFAPWEYQLIRKAPG